MAGIDGLISGLNTTQIISQLMQVERLPEQQLINHKNDSSTMVSTLQGLNTLFTTLQNAAQLFAPDSITKQSAWSSTLATSSNTGLATATTSANALPGSATFTVTSVATAGSVVSTGTVSSLTGAVTDGSPLLLSKGAAAVGFSGLEPGGPLSAGSHAIQVTQSSAGAIIKAQSPLQGSVVTIDSTNNKAAFYLDGTVPAQTFNLEAGSYTPTQLAAELQRASGGALTASVGTDGKMSVTSAHEGSAATLQVADTGTANAALGFTDTTTVARGTDGKVTLDGGTEAVISSVSPGGQVTLTNAAGDSIVATLNGGLRAGSATATSIASGTGLADVVKAINASGAGVTATAVGVSTGTYRLQLTSTTTGSNSDLTLNAGAFPPGISGLGGMQELHSGSDTVLRVGTGAGAFNVTSSTTSVDGLLPGVTINALAVDPNTPVTVNVTADSGGMADKMAALVAAANSVLSYIDTNSTWDPDKKVGGPLLGDSMARSLRQQITDLVIGTSSSTPAMNGVFVAKDGTLTFDRSTFLASYAKDPASVAATMTTMSSSMATLAKQASDPISGSVTVRISNENDNIRDYTKQIADFEDRMTLRQQTLQTQYAALETALGSLQSQSQWLAGQLNSLPTPKSSS